MFQILRVIALSGVLIGCASLPTRGTAKLEASYLSEAEIAASAARFRQDLETLSSDDFEGRESGTAGYLKAVAYMTNAFEDIGITPAGDEGYLQQVTVRSIRPKPDSSSMLVNGEELTLFRDFFIAGNVYAPTTELEADIIFMGYGIDAPKFGHTAYDEVDVTGKIVAVLPGMPRGLPSEERAHFRNAKTKGETAAAHGAAGLLIVNPTGGMSGRRLQHMARVSNKDVVHAADGAYQRLPVQAYLTNEGTDKLAAAAGMDLRDLTPENAGTLLDVQISIRSESEWEEFTSPNVIGVIEGADPKLKDEYVILTAHLDHIGKLRTIERNPNRDVINNGALDNASGISTLLEVARKFKASGQAPRRSILLVALTSEEIGLLGSEYFANSPTVPHEAMVANVNLDMPILLHDFSDVIAFGAEHSSLKGVTAAAASTMGVELMPDPVPEQALFVRSDHYSFVKQGVPSVFLFLGFGNGGKQKFHYFLGSHYHKPSDEPDLPIKYEVAAKFSELNYRIARAIANEDQRPSWNDDSFFGQAFGQ